MSTNQALNPVENDLDAFIGRRVHQLMWDQQLTQTAFGQLIGIDQSLVAKRLRGKVAWPMSLVVRSARVLNTSVAYLVGETNDSTPPIQSAGSEGGWAPSGSNRRPKD